MPRTELAGCRAAAVACRSEQLRGMQHQQVDRDQDGFVDRAELRAAVGPAAVDAGAGLVEGGHSPNSGRMSTREFMRLLEATQE
jgi:hypothetical protein